MNTRNGRRIALFVLISLVGLGLAIWADGPVYRMFTDHKPKETDLTRMFRVVGYLPTWIVVALAIGLMKSAVAKGRAVLREPGLLLAAVVSCGLVSEGLKLLIRRERPTVADGAYQFLPWSDFRLSSAGLATPSGHASVAFAAAWMLSRLYPRGRPVWIGLAVGCGMQRVAFQAHYVSDVFLSAVFSYALVWWMWRRWGETG